MDPWGRRLVLDMTFDDVVSIALRELEREGFEILGQVNVRDALQRILGEDFRHYTFITAWHPALTLRALRDNLDVGVELPVNLSIYELADEETVVAAAEALPSLSEDRSWREEWPELCPIEIELNERLARVLDGISHRAVPMMTV